MVSAEEEDAARTRSEPDEKEGNNLVTPIGTHQTDGLLQNDRSSSPPAFILSDDQLQKKKAQIASACTRSDGDDLTKLATSAGGLLSDRLRKQAWPLLLNGGYKSSNGLGLKCAWQDLPQHEDEGQVKLDVNRSFIYYPNGESEEQLDRRKVDLLNVITEVLRRHPMLCYFQGFHDIAQVFLLVLGRENAADAVAHLSLLRIRDFMLPSLTPSLAHLELLPAIIYSVDSTLYQRLRHVDPYFALAATLTLYAHDIEDYNDIARLFDFLLAHEAVVSVYLFAVIVLSRKHELLDIPADEPEMLQHVLSKIPRPFKPGNYIRRTMALLRDYPPKKLPFRAWSKVSGLSVLKTTNRSSNVKSLEDGEDLFRRQEAQLKRQQFRKKVITALWRYRQPASGLALAILVGVVSFWLRKNDGYAPTAIWRIWNVVKVYGRT